MIIHAIDFNGAAAVIANSHEREWAELQQTLTEMPLHLKASDQAGIQGTRVFDVKGTNQYIKQALTAPGLDWGSNIPIPRQYAFLGLSVDFFKSGLLVEAQFSNYPFLLNNMLRSELFFKAKSEFNGRAVEAVVMITKARMFPASNSTLYYEQAVSQLSQLAQNKVFDVPIRLVGLFERTGQPVSIKLTEYDNPRYSRRVVASLNYQCNIIPATGRGRCTFEIDQLDDI